MQVYGRKFKITNRTKRQSYIKCEQLGFSLSLSTLPIDTIYMHILEATYINSNYFSEYKYTFLQYDVMLCVWFEIFNITFFCRNSK